MSNNPFVLLVGYCRVVNSFTFNCASFRYPNTRPDYARLLLFIYTINIYDLSYLTLL